MAGDLDGAFNLAEIAANACSHRCPFDKLSNLLVVQPLRPGSLPLPRNAAKYRLMSQICELDPGLDRGNRAGRIAGAAADLELSPTGFAAPGDTMPLSRISIQPRPPSVGAAFRYGRSSLLRRVKKIPSTGDADFAMPQQVKVVEDRRM
jgi:hypothetical protein